MFVLLPMTPWIPTSEDAPRARIETQLGEIGSPLGSEPPPETPRLAGNPRLPASGSPGATAPGTTPLDTPLEPRAPSPLCRLYLCLETVSGCSHAHSGYAGVVVEATAPDWASVAWIWEERVCVAACIVLLDPAVIDRVPIIRMHCVGDHRSFS